MIRSQPAPSTALPSRLDAAVQAYWEQCAEGRFDRDAWRQEFGDVANEAESWLADYAAIQDLWRDQRGSSRRAATPPDLLPLPYSLGQYTLQEVVGWGGMGVVYRAWQATLKRHVAVKVIRPDKLAELAADERERWRQRFQFEIEAAGRVSQCDHVVTVLDAFTSGELSCYVMEYVDGRSLSDVVRERPLAPIAAAQCLERVARAVFEIHKHGLLHLDIKPLNILMSGSPSRPLVTDFGLARSVCWGEVDSDGAVGTPRYMAPELFGSSLPDSRSSTVSNDRGSFATEPTWAADVYSLGATLVHVLCGGPPPGDASTPDAAVKRWRELSLAGVDADLKAICRKCLAPRPADRYASAAELADDLQRYCDGRPTLARRNSVFHRLKLWVRRNPALALAVVALLTFVGGFAYHLRQSQRHQQTQQASLAWHKARADRLARQRLAHIDRVLTDVDAAPNSSSSVAGNTQTLREVQQELDEWSVDASEAVDVSWLRLEAHFRLGQIYLRHGNVAGAGGLDAAARSFDTAGAICRKLQAGSDRADDARQMRWKCMRLLLDARLRAGDLAVVERDLPLLIDELRAHVSAPWQLMAEPQLNDAERPVGGFRDPGAAQQVSQAELATELEQVRERQETLAKCWLLSAELAERLRDSTKCETSLREARQLLHDLLGMQASSATAAINTDNRRLAETFARCLELLAKHYDAEQQTEQAIACAEENVAVRNRILEQAPGDDLARRELVTAELTLASITRSQGVEAKAIANYEKELDSLRKRRAGMPSTSAELKDEAVLLERLAGLQDRLGSVSRAAGHYETSLSLLIDAARLNPTDVEIDVNVAIRHRQVARIKLRQGDENAAREHAEQGVELQRELLRKYPSDVAHREKLALALLISADVHTQLREYETAQRLARESCEIYGELSRSHALRPQDTVEWLRAQHWVAYCALQLANLDAAEPALTECLTNLDALARTNASRQEVLSLRSQVMASFARLSAERKDWVNADSHARDAIRAVEEALRESPRNSFYLRHLAFILTNAGNDARDSGKLDVALQFTTRNIETSEQLAKLDSSNEDSQLLLASAYLRHAKVLARLDQRKDALRFTRKSLEIRQSRLARQPKNCQRIRELRLAWHDLGQLLADEGRHDEAIVAWTNAVATVDQLVALNQAEPDDLANQYYDLNGLSTSAFTAQRFLEVLYAREQQLVYLQSVAARDGTTDNWDRLARLLKLTGVLQRDLGTFPRAEQLIDGALAVYERLSKMEPERRKWKFERLATLVDRAKTEYERYRVSEARHWYELAREGAEAWRNLPSVSGSEPGDAALNIDKLLGEIHRGLADCDDAADSIADLQRAERNLLRANESRALSLSLLLRVAELCRRGDFTAARATAARLAELASKKDQSLLLQAARAYAICAAATQLSDSKQSDDDARRACEVLVRTRERGLLANDTRFARLWRHQDFDVLRGRRDFQQVLCETNPDDPGSTEK